MEQDDSSEKINIEDETIPFNDRLKTAIYCSLFFILGLISSILGPSLEILVK